MRGRADDAGPDDPVHGPSELVVNVRGVLEEAGAPTDLNDAIIKLIEDYERVRDASLPEYKR